MQNTSASGDTASSARTEQPGSSAESSTRDDRGRFRPGVTGNAKGRPRSGLALAEAIRQHVAPELLISVAGSIVQNKDAPPNVRLAACEFLASRGYQKPTERVELSQGAPDSHEDLRDLSDAELDELEHIERRRTEILTGGSRPAIEMTPIADPAAEEGERHA